MPSTGQSRDGSVSLDLDAKGVIEVQLVSSGEKWGLGPAKDIHSSLMARVDSPAWHLIKALDTPVADDGFTPTVDGWFENVRPLTPREKELLAASLPKDEEAVKKVLGVRRWIQDEDFLTSTYRLASQPLEMAAGHFGVGRGGGAHAPDEWPLIESSDPKVAGYAQHAEAFVDYLYETARAAKTRR